MTPPAERRRPRLGFRLGLGARLMLVMGAALLPLAVLSYTQTVATQRVAESRARAAILGETLSAATPLVDIILQAQGTATTLAASLPAYVDDPEACDQAMSRIARLSEGRYSFVGFVPRDGHITCSSDPGEHDIGQTPWLARMLADPQPRLSVSRNASISHTSVLNLSVPVRREGAVIGLMSISMPHDVIQAQSAAQGRGEGSAPLALTTFDEDGMVLTASTGLDQVAATLPASRALGSFVGLRGQSFLDTTITGKRRAFAVVPLAPGGLYVLGSWPAERLDDDSLIGDLPTLTFPLLMWAASLLAAWLAAESQVLRHIRALRDSIKAFTGLDRRVVPLRLSGAATELEEVAEAYQKMTLAILHDEADLQNVIHQKEVLLREVHHRVKNNLQLIASILNMQLRTAHTDEAREAMKSIQERVLSLATIHRELYQTSGLTDIRAAELLPQILRHTARIGAAPGRAFDLDLQVADIRLTPDQAVPLALFLTEGTTNALKHAWRGAQDRSRISLRVALRPDGMAEVELRNALQPLASGAARADAALLAPSDGFGGKLLSAFAQQLEGTLERRREAESYLLRLVFPIRPLDHAEARTSPVATSDLPPVSAAS